MRIFIEIEVRMLPFAFAAAKKQRNGIVVHREKRDGGSDIYMAKNAEILRDMRTKFGDNAHIAVTYIFREEDAIV